MTEIDEESTKIKFPCDYPIKVVGDACDNFDQVIVDVIKKHAPDLDESTITKRDSKKGNYQSLSVIIQAQGKPQLDAMFEDLKATGIVRMVL